MVDHGFFTTDALAYCMLGVCVFMILAGFIRFFRVYSTMKVREHDTLDIHAIYDVFKKDVTQQTGLLDRASEKMVLQEFYKTQLPSDQRYIN